MQTLCIEFARHVLSYEDANSSEFDVTSEHSVIDLMPDQRDIIDMGGTMRLGIYPCALKEGTTAWESYGKAESVNERHRHRFEFNNDFRTVFEENGAIFSGLSPDGRLVEIVELKDHPFMVGSQFHPEFASRPNLPHPLFSAFIEAAVTHRGKTKQTSSDSENGYVSPDKQVKETLDS